MRRRFPCGVSRSWFPLASRETWSGGQSEDLNGPVLSAWAVLLRRRDWRQRPLDRRPSGRHGSAVRSRPDFYTCVHRRPRPPLGRGGRREDRLHRARLPVGGTARSRASTPGSGTSCSAGKTSRHCAKPRSWSRPGVAITTRRGRTAPWDAARRHRKPSWRQAGHPARPPYPLALP